MNIKVDFDNIVVKEDRNDFNVKVLMLKGEKGDAGDGENNVIEKVQVNGTDLPVTNKTVNVSVPVVDSTISSSSTNPVQNSAIYTALNNKADLSALDNYYETSEVDNLLSTKIDTTTFNTSISNETTARANADTNLQNQITGLASGSPTPVSSTSQMTDTTKVYVNTTDGNWYYYNGSAWVSGGTYQATLNPAFESFMSLNYKEDNYIKNINRFNLNSDYIIKDKYTSGSSFTNYAKQNISHPIFVENGVSYKFKTYSRNIIGNYGRAITYLNPDGSIKGYQTGTFSNDYMYVTFTANATGYVVVNLGNYGTNKLVFCEEAYYDDDLEYNYSNNTLKINSKNIDNKITNEQIVNFLMSDNLYNKNSNMNITGKLIGSSGYGNYSRGIVSHPIYLRKGDIVRCYHNASNYGNNISIAECLEDGTYVKYIDGTLDDNIITNVIPKDGYYCFQIYNGDNETAMVVKNREYPSEYIPYSTRLNNVNIPYIDNILENLGAKLMGKSITYNGDSICAGAGYTGGYPKIIGDKYNMTVQNIAEGGATITSEQYAQSGNARHWINATITNMNSDYDYAIVEGGVNDASLGVPLGTISNGYNATLDTTTFCGAFENMLKQLVNRFAGKKYGYIMVHQMTANMRVINEESTSYYWLAKKCCEKWGVPFLDLNDKVPPFAFFTSGSPLYALRQTYTYNSDGWHPNQAGYEKYYVDKIIAWLESL